MITSFLNNNPRFTTQYLYLLIIGFALLCTYNGGGYYLTLWAIICLVCLPIIISLISRKNHPFTIIDIIVFSFTCWISLSMFWSEDSDTSFAGLSRIGLFGLSYFSLKALNNHAKNQNLNAIIVRLTCTLLVLFAAFPSLDRWVVGEPIRSGGLYYDPNVAATLILFPCIVLLHQLIFAQLKKSSYIIILTAFFISFLGFCFTESRSAALGLAPAFILFFFTSLKKYNFLKAVYIWTLPTLSMILAIAISTIMGSGFLGRLSDIGNAMSNSENIRYTLLKGAWDIFNTYPILGSGIGTFHILYDRYRTEPFDLGLYTHNDYMQILAETGVIGLILFLILGLLCAKFIFTELFKKESSPSIHTYTTLKLPLALWLLAIFIQSLFYYVFYNIAVAMLAGWAFFIITKKTNSNHTSYPVHSGIKYITASVLCLFLLLTGLDSYFFHNQKKITQEPSLDTLHRLELFGIGKHYPKLSLATVYFQKATKTKDPKAQLLMLEYGLDRACTYLESVKTNRHAFNLLSKFYYAFDVLDQPRKSCHKPLPQNRFEALEQSIKLAPFKSLDGYNILTQWYEKIGDYENSKRIKNEFAITSALIFDRENQKTQEDALKYMEYNQYNLKNQQKKIAQIKLQSEKRNTFFHSLFFDLERER